MGSASGQPAGDEAKVRAEMRLNEIPFKIVYESYRGTSWDLCMVGADGSGQVNLTHTPDVDELYPHVSPDGTRICCVIDETVGAQKVRNLYLMNMDGTGRIRIADNAREGCWSADGRWIAYLPAEFPKYTLTDYASKGMMIYDVATGKHAPHPNAALHHLYNLTWSPDRDWFVGTVHGGMGFKHAVLAFEANGTRVFDLAKWGVGGCRPDLIASGAQLAWGANDETLKVGDVAFGGTEPRVEHVRALVHCAKGFKVYHVDWAPDGRHVAFSFGPEAGKEMPGQRAPTWNICVADLGGNWVPVTTDGLDNKEPDWVPLSAGTK
ncbi:MAG TPA: hypothetical protein PLU30_08675 [Verrucomicrobiae bacterium]|nr:hypothetical protein [Verrucomicrobiae bacterium]